MIFGLFGAMVAVIWKGSTMMASGVIDAGELFSFVIYSGFVGGNFGGMANVYTQIQKFIGATEELFDLFNESEEELENESDIKNEELLKGEIIFRDLSFRYPSRPEEDVLTSLNHKIAANQMVALVGTSGAGKSTIASLLLRLYEPTSGDIYYDGRKSHEYSLSALRSQIALVPQDVFLFGGTIKENISYGKPGSTDEEIYDAAAKANALEFIDRFPARLETVVGERGTQLSGGQRQRIAQNLSVLFSRLWRILW